MRDVKDYPKYDINAKKDSVINTVKDTLKNINYTQVTDFALKNTQTGRKILNLTPVKKFKQLNSAVDTAIKKATPFLKASGLADSLGVNSSIGSWGKNLVFEVSAYSIRTFKDLKTTAGAKYADIELLEGKPRKQYIAPTNRTASMTVTIRADQNWLKPRDLIDVLQKSVENGEANYLIVGGVPLSTNPYILTGINADWSLIYSRGELYKADLELSFEEYDPKSHI